MLQALPHAERRKFPWGLAKLKGLTGHVSEGGKGETVTSTCVASLRAATPCVLHNYASSIPC